MSNFVKYERGVAARLKAAGLNERDALVLLELMTFWDRKTGTIFPSADTIAGLTGLEPWTVRRALKSIRKSGLLRDDGQRAGWMSLRWQVTDRLRAIMGAA